MSQEELLIRLATSSDAEAMTGCIELAYERYVPIIGKKPGPMLDDYSQVVLRHHAFIAEFDHHLVGILVLIKHQNGLLLDNVAVHPDYQGKGFGGQLVSFAEAEAARLGYTELELYTHELMIDNYQLYKRLGYIEVERREEKGFSRIYMKKHLNQSIQ